MSVRIASAFKRSSHVATMAYSELCQLAPLTRQRTLKEARKKLAGLIRPHLGSGYLG